MAIAEAAVCGPMRGCSRGWSLCLGQSWCITTAPRPWLCFLRAYVLGQQGRKAPPVLLQQVALSAEEEPGPEEDGVGPLFAEVKNSVLVLLRQVALPADEGPGPEEDRVGPLSAEVENPTQVATASCSAVSDAPVGPLGVSFVGFATLLNSLPSREVC